MTESIDNFIETAGFRWRIRETGSGEGAPLLLLHGFTGSGELWSDAATRLQERRCIMPDLPGHGGSGSVEPEGQWSLRWTADRLLDLVETMRIDAFDLAGYSMGGRLALQLAIRHTTRVRRLVLIGASAGIASEKERQERLAADEEIARMLEERGIEAFVDYWEALPLFSGGSLSGETRQRMRMIRLANDPVRLAAALRRLGPGAQTPLHPYLPDLMTPTLLVAGGRDAKYRAIAYEMAATLPRARVEIIGEAGHAVPVEAPWELALAMNRFLSSPNPTEGDEERE